MAKTHKKRNLTSVLSILLVLALVVSGTLALYTYFTGTPKENTFTFTPGNGIEIAINEPNWVATNADGIDLANMLSVQQSIPKDPQFTNISSTTEASVYGALRITWVKADTKQVISQSDFENYILPYIELADLNDGDAYTPAEGTFEAPKEVYYYNTEVAYNADPSQASSTPLFTAVNFKTVAELTGGLTSDDYVKAQAMWNSWGGFEIIVEGAAVDTSAGTAGTAKSDLDGLFAANPIPTPLPTPAS